MNKIKPMLLSVTLAAPAVWALALIIPLAGTPVLAPTIANQVNPFELMSVAKNLPVRTYEAF